MQKILIVRWMLNERNDHKSCFNESSELFADAGSFGNPADPDFLNGMHSQDIQGETRRLFPEQPRKKDCSDPARQAHHPQ